jgi:integrase
LPTGAREVTRFEDGTGLGSRISKSSIGFIGQLPLKDGSHWRWSIGGYGKLTIEQARAVVQAVACEIALGVDPRVKRAEEKAATKAQAEAAETEKFTVARVIERWHAEKLSTKRRGYATRSYRNVVQTFRGLLDIPAAALTRVDVKKALVKQRSNETRPAAARNAVTAIGTAFRWALSEDLIAQNPIAGIKPPGSAPERDRVLTIGEMRRIYAAAGDLPYPAGQFVRLLMLSGCRRAEIARLFWTEVVTEADRSKAIEIPPGPRTKTGAGHYVSLSKVALEIIAECMRYRIVGSPYVLSNDGRRAFGGFDRTKRRIDQALIDSGAEVVNWRLHDFRSALVSILAGEPHSFGPMAFDRLLGHQPRQLNKIARIYQRAELKAERVTALEVWGELLTRPPAAVSDLRQERERGGAR